jgi:LysR family transcriptional regulator, nod-box dependent transcriptional activator
VQSLLASGTNDLAKSQNLRNINLNSLPVLREILRQGSVSKAAEALNLTQPALSNMLKQLRAHFDDELVVRDGLGMRMTAKGQAILAPLEQALTSLENVLDEQAFDPSRSTDQFRIATSDHIINVLSVPVAKIMAAEAPLMQAQFLMINRQTALELKAGHADFAIASSATLGSGLTDTATTAEISGKYLTSERLVYIARSDDADVTKGLSLAQYLARPHATFALDSEHHASVESMVLADMGHRQNNRLLLSTYQSLPMIVAETGCLAVMPETMAINAARLYPIQIATPPIAFPHIKWLLIWHKRNDKNPVMLWVREMIPRCLDAFCSVPVATPPTA